MRYHPFILGERRKGKREVGRDGKKKDNKPRRQGDTEYASKCNVSKSISLRFMPGMTSRGKQVQTGEERESWTKS